MKKHHSMFAIEKMCKVFKVSKSGYYHWINRKPSTRQVDEQQALKLIKEIHQASKSRWTRCSATCRSMVVQKLLMNLRKKGVSISRPRVARIMRKANIRSIVQKQFRVCTTDSNHNYPVANNLLNRYFTPENTGKAWVSDGPATKPAFGSTYIKTIEGWLYLTVIVDLADRKVIGWADLK